MADGVATITLDRPERLNAWTATMNAEYRAHLRTAADDPAVRVIVVTGAGRGFCAGAESEDLAGHAERGCLRPGRARRPGHARATACGPSSTPNWPTTSGSTKPVLAAVNGPVAGIGFALACYCDLRFAARGARFTTAHGKLGLPCAFGLAWLLPKLVGLPRALDLILTSRTFDADEALRLGLVTEVVDGPDLMEHVRAYARTLATTVSPASLAASKRQVYEAFHQTAAESVRAAEALLDPMMAGPDYREGVAALRAKRAPVFGDPG